MQKFFHSGRWILFLTLAVGFFVLAAPRSALAASVVGNGTPASCTEAAFNAALAVGGKITFNCGAAVKTITITTLKEITVPTTIIGKRKIILRAQNTGHFFISNGIDFALKAITLSRASFHALFNDGQTKLTRVRFEKNRDEDYGGAIYNRGILTIKKSSFIKNRVRYGGGAIINDGGTTTIRKSAFIKNRTTVTKGDPLTPSGGAITSDGGVLTIQDTVFQDNKSFVGGAVHATAATVEITGTSFTGNKAFEGGGAIFVEKGTTSLTRVVVKENSSEFGGGITALGDLTLVESSVIRNTAQQNGGGVDVDDIRLEIHDSTISGNIAQGFGGGVRSNAKGKITNSTVSGNQSVLEKGGGWYQTHGSIDLTFVTLANNSAGGGGGGVFANQEDGSELWFENSLLANNTGGNCGGGEIITLNHNLSDDASCQDSFTGTKDQNNASTKLGPLANNGGPTLTHKPQAGSPAIDKGTNLVTTTNDQRGVARPQGSSSDIGAVEVE